MFKHVSPKDDDGGRKGENFNTPQKCSKMLDFPYHSNFMRESKSVMRAVGFSRERSVLLIWDLTSLCEKLTLFRDYVVISLPRNRCGTEDFLINQKRDCEATKNHLNYNILQM